MLKRILPCLLAFIMLTLSVSALADSSTDSNVIYVDSSTTYNDCMAADIIVVSDETKSIIRDYAKTLVDNGKILYVRNSALNKEGLAQYFSIPKNTRSIYNDLEHMACTIYSANGKYVFSYIYVCTDSSASTADVQTADISSIANTNYAFDSAMDLYNTAQNEPCTSFALTRGIPSSSDEIFSDVVRIYNTSGQHIGDGLATQYVYKKGYGRFNGEQVYVYDALTVFKGAPQNVTYLKKYVGRIHCNITGHYMVDYEILPTNTSASSSLNVSGTDVSSSTSWTYTPDSQSVSTLGVPSSKYVECTGNPLVVRYGQSWEMIPGIRVASTQPAGSRGVFSKITIPSLGFWGEEIQSYSVEVGGWF